MGRFLVYYKQEKNKKEMLTLFLCLSLVVFIGCFFMALFYFLRLSDLYISTEATNQGIAEAQQLIVAYAEKAHKIEEKLLLYKPYYDRLNEEMSIVKECSATLRNNIIWTLFHKNAQVDCLSVKLGNAKKTMDQIQNLRSELLKEAQELQEIYSKISEIIRFLPNSGKNAISEILLDNKLLFITLHPPRLVAEIPELQRLYMNMGKIDGYDIINAILKFPKLKVNASELYSSKEILFNFPFNLSVYDFFITQPPVVFEIILLISLLLIVQLTLLLFSINK